MIVGPQVFNGINDADDKEDHHGEPHGDVKIEVADGLIEDGLGWYMAQEAGDESIKKQGYARYFPPILSKHMTFLKAGRSADAWIWKGQIYGETRENRYQSFQRKGKRMMARVMTMMSRPMRRDIIPEAPPCKVPKAALEILLSSISWGMMMGKPRMAMSAALC